MAPPFIAYFAITQGGDGALELLQAAYDQCRLHRDQLFDADVSLWRHIALGTWQDNIHWATGVYDAQLIRCICELTKMQGNGWAAAGMLRVMETMKNSAYADQLGDQTSNISSWINEIMAGVWVHQVSLHIHSLWIAIIEHAISKTAVHFSTSWTTLPLSQIHQRQRC